MVAEGYECSVVTGKNSPRFNARVDVGLIKDTDKDTRHFLGSAFRGHG